MSLAFLIYLISVLGKVVTFLSSLGIILGMLTGATLFGYAVNCMAPSNTDAAKTCLKSSKRLAIAAIAVFSLFTVIPSEKTAWMMVGGAVAQNVYESEAGDKLKQIVSNKLDSILQEQLDSAKERK